MTRPWIEALARFDREGEPAVLLTIISARGSVPREAGCKMVVTRDAQVGTIGGGNLEFRCIAISRGLLDTDDAAPAVHDFPLGPALGQCCGGHLSILFEPLIPVAMPVALFGAGHVGRALAMVLSRLPCRLTWIDSRADAFPADMPRGAERRIMRQPDMEISALKAGSLVLVMTHDHQIDFEIVLAALKRIDIPAVGLIGSATKRARFVSRLIRSGLGTADLARLICPIGVPGINNKDPDVIAISVAAQVMLLREQHDRRRPASVEASCSSCPREAEGLCV